MSLLPNTSSKADGSAGLEPITVIGNIFTMTMNLVNIIISSMAVFILHRCRRMPFQLRRLSYNIFLPDTVFNLVLFFIGAACLGLGKEKLDLIRQLRVIFGSPCALISLASVACLTLDRFIAIRKPLTYTMIVTKNVVSVMCVYVWLVNTMAPLSIILVSIYITGGFHYTTLYWKIFSMTFALFYTVYHVFIVYAYVIISRCLRQKVAAITKFRENENTRISTQSQEKNNIASTTIIAKIVLTYEIANFPVFLHALFFIIFPDLRSVLSVSIFQFIDFLCYCASVYICFALYVWRMSACKIVFLSTFLSWNERAQRMANRLRVEVYNMVHLEGH